MKISVADKTLCNEGSSYSFKEKIEIARQLEKLSVDVIEMPEIKNIKADTLLIKTISSFVKNSIVSVNAGMSRESIDNTASALQNTLKPRIRIELPVSTVGMEYVCHKKAPKMIETVKSLIEYAKEKCDDVEFCAVDATRAEKDVLFDILETAFVSGAKTVTVCDTSARMLPQDFYAFSKEIVEKFRDKNVELGVFCDDKNSLAAANAITAVKNGISVIKTDIGGNGVSLTAIASIVKNCGVDADISSNIKYTEINRIVKQINWIIANDSNDKPNDFSSESNLNEIKLNKDDSRETVEKAVIGLGYDLSDEDVDRVFDEFIKVAAKKNVGSVELDAIVASVALQVPSTYKLVSYVVNSGNIIPTTAQITLEKEGQRYQGISFGDGSIDAAFLSIEQIIGHHYELDDFQIQSVTEGKEAVGSATVKLRHDGKLYSGNGISTDIICASIMAYLSAVNKIVYEEA